MVSPILLVVVAVILWRWIWYRPPNFPPGPPRLPLIGSYPILLAINYRHMHRAVQRLCKYYASPIIGFHHGPFPIIVCNDVDTIREALRNPDLDGKPNIVMTQMRAPDFRTRGLFFTHQDLWRDNRRFSLRHMRDFGFGRRQPDFEMDVSAEVRNLLALIRDGPQMAHEREFCREGGGVMLCPNMFYVVLGNSVMRALFNETIPRSEEQGDLYRIGQSAVKFLLEADAYGKLFSLLPFLPYMSPEWSDYGRLRKAAMEQYAWVAERLRVQWETYNETVEVGGMAVERSFLEMYFKKMREGGQDKTFNMDQLVMICVDFILPAFSTLSSVLSFMVMRWIADPTLLRRIQAEIDEVVGQSRLPDLDDRINLPYTEAAIRETMRLNTTVPNGFAHRALNSTKLAGYNVPGGTYIITNLYAAHSNDGTFADAHRFRPERFLDAAGRLSVAQDASLPFGTGKRLCPGETFSRNMLFVLVAVLAQNFDVSVATAGATAWQPDVDECCTGVINFPPETWVRFEQR